MGWRDRVKAADSEAKVLDLATRFVASFSVEELERLPPALRPGAFRTADELRAFAQRLVRYDADSTDGATRLALRMSSVISAATARLHELTAKA